MRRDHHSIRPGTLPAAAVLVLAALAATVPALDHRPAARIEPRPLMSEATAMRVFAAAVAAVARDLAGAERQTAATLVAAAEIAAAPALGLAERPRLAGRHPLEALAERLLDLPPPIC